MRRLGSESGTSLIEVLVASALITILLLPVLSGAVMAEKLQRTGAIQVDRMQNLRLAAWHVTRDVRFARTATLVDNDPERLQVTAQDGSTILYVFSNGQLSRQYQDRVVAGDLASVTFTVNATQRWVEVELVARPHPTAGSGQASGFPLRTRVHWRNGS